MLKRRIVEVMNRSFVENIMRKVVKSMRDVRKLSSVGFVVNFVNSETICVVIFLHIQDRNPINVRNATKGLQGKML